MKRKEVEWRDSGTKASCGKERCCSMQLIGLFCNTFTVFPIVKTSIDATHYIVIHIYGQAQKSYLRYKHLGVWANVSVPRVLIALLLHLKWKDFKAKGCYALYPGRGILMSIHVWSIKAELCLELCRLSAFWEGRHLKKNRVH